jgi:hypothetical protein
MIRNVWCRTSRNRCAPRIFPCRGGWPQGYIYTHTHTVYIYIYNFDVPHIFFFPYTYLFSSWSFSVFPFSLIYYVPPLFCLFICPFKLTFQSLSVCLSCIHLLYFLILSSLIVLHLIFLVSLLHKVSSMLYLPFTISFMYLLLYYFPVFCKLQTLLLFSFCSLHLFLQYFSYFLVSNCPYSLCVCLSSRLICL